MRILIFLFALKVLAGSNNPTTSSSSNSTVFFDGNKFELELVGTGAYARVYKTRELHPKIVKVTRKDGIMKDVSKRETKILKRLGLYLGSTKVDGQSAIITKYVQGTSLSRLRLNSTISKRVYEIGLKQLELMHEMGIVHNDISSSNVIIDFSKGITVSFVDFGISQHFNCPESICKSAYKKDKFLIDHYCWEKVAFNSACI